MQRPIDIFLRVEAKADQAIQNDAVELAGLVMLSEIRHGTNRVQILRAIQHLFRVAIDRIKLFSMQKSRIVQGIDLDTGKQNLPDAFFAIQIAKNLLL